MANVTVYDPEGNNRRKNGQRSARIPEDDAESVETEEIPNTDDADEARNEAYAGSHITPSESESAADSGDIGDGNNPFSWKQPENDFTAYKKRGPKPIEINWIEFDKLCKLQCTLEEIAGWFGCSEDTIERAVKKQYNIKFADYFKVKSVGGKIAVRRALHQKVKEGNTAVIMYMAKAVLKLHDVPDKDPKPKPGDPLPGTPEDKKEKEPDTYTINYLGIESDENVIVELEDDTAENASDTSVN